MTQNTIVKFQSFIDISEDIVLKVCWQPSTTKRLDNYNCLFQLFCFTAFRAQKGRGVNITWCTVS